MKNRQLPCPVCGRALRRPWLLFPNSNLHCPSCRLAFELRLAGTSFSLHAAFFILTFAILKLVEHYVLPDRRLLPGEVGLSIAILIGVAVAAVLAGAGRVTMGAADPHPRFHASGGRLLGITGAAMVLFALLVVALWLVAYDQSPRAAFLGSVLGVIEAGLVGVYILVDIARRRRRPSESAKAA